MLSSPRGRITDGENTTKRFTIGQQRDFDNRRLVLKGFPWSGKFQTLEEVKAYLSGDRMQCLLCGKPYVMIGKHLREIHGVTVDQYKERYGIPWGRGLVCADTKKVMSANTKRRIYEGGFNRGCYEAPNYIQRKRCPAVKNLNLEKLQKINEKPFEIE